MKQSSYSYPYPVLGREDDIEGFFNADTFIGIDREIITIQVNFSLNNETLINLLKKTNAEYCIEVDCPNTMFRKSFKTTESSLNIKILSSELRGRVKINAYLASNNNINAYCPTGMNTLFSGYTFDIGLSERLAITESVAFPAEKSWEKLRSVSSFMQIQKSNIKEGPVDFKLDDEKITIFLSEKDYINYKRIHTDENLSSTFHSSFVLAALILAVNSTMEEECPYTGKAWYVHLLTLIENDTELLQLWNNPENVTKICQKILGNPIQRSLYDINNFIDSLVHREDD